MSIARAKNNDPEGGASPRKGLAHRASWKRVAWTFWRDESGQDLIEYALVAGLIGLGCIASMKGLTNSIATLFTKLGSTLINST